MTDPVSELITDAIASTVLPDIATVAVRANMVDYADAILYSHNLFLFKRSR